MNKLKSIFNFFIEYNFIVAFGSLAMYFQTLILCNQELKLSPYPFLLFFASLLDYNSHKLLKNKFHSENKNEKLQIFSSLKTILLISIIGLSISFLNVSNELYIKLFSIGAVTILYSLPFAIKHRSISIIKKIPFLKTIMIAFVWTYLTLNIPIDLSKTNLNKIELISLFVARFSFIAAITLPFDIRDKEVDQKDGIVTLAHVFTSNQIQKIIICLLMLMNFFAIYYLYQSGNLLFGFSFIVSSIVLVYFTYSKSMLSHQYYYKVLLDGMLIIQFLLVYLFSIV